MCEAAVWRHSNVNRVALYTTPARVLVPTARITEAKLSVNLTLARQTSERRIRLPDAKELSHLDSIQVGNLLKGGLWAIHAVELEDGGLLRFVVVKLVAEQAHKRFCEVDECGVRTKLISQPEKLLVVREALIICDEERLRLQRVLLPPVWKCITILARPSVSTAARRTTSTHPGAMKTIVLLHVAATRTILVLHESPHVLAVVVVH